MASMFSGYLLMSVMIMCWMYVVHSQLPPCYVKPKCQPSPLRHFHIDGHKVPTMLFTGLFYKNQTSEPCSLNLTDFVKTCFSADPQEGHHLVMGLKCIKRRHIVFDRTQLANYRNVLLSVHIFNCIISLDDIDWIGSQVEFRVFATINTEILPSALPQNTSHNFTGLGNIVSLHMSNINSTNRLENIFPRHDVYKSMAEIALRNMSIVHLPADFPSRMPRLQYLDLLYNDMTVPPHFPWQNDTQRLPRNLARTNVFNSQYATSLGIELKPYLFRRGLLLGLNKIQTLQGNMLSGWVQLLTLSANGLTQLHPDFLSRMIGLEQLDISVNHISNLAPGTFEHPNLRTLRGLNLRQNLLQTLQNVSFDALLNLITLDLSHNKLRFIPSGAFSMLWRLKSLNLAHNRLDLLMPSSLPVDTPYMTEILLNGNLFNHIPSEVFSVGALNTIDLSACNINFDTLYDSLTEIPLINLYNIQTRKNREKYTKTIKLNNNNITYIPSYPHLFPYRFLLANYRLELKDNPIGCYCSTSDFITYVKEEVSKGRFDGNEYFFSELKCSQPTEFYGRSVLSLESTDMYCPVDRIDCPKGCECFQFTRGDEFMVNCSSLRLDVFPDDLPPGTVDLRLKNNNITTLTIRSSQGSLRSLDLSSNHISKVDDSCLKLLPNLKRLDISHNVLTSIPPGFQYLALDHLNISNNHFLCDCDMLWTKGWLYRQRDVIDDWNKVDCLHGERKRSSIITVPDSEFTCTFNDFWKYYVAIAISVVFLLLLIVLVLAYRFRLDIRAFIFVRLSSKLFRPKHVSAHPLPLAAFVVSSKKDVEWTKQNIIKNVEESGTVSYLALSFVDFIPGISFQENFDLFTESSMKIVIVLSESLLQNDLCVSCLEKAIQMSLATRSNSIVLVEMNKSYIPALVKNATIRRFLRTQIKLNSKDKLFREKLLYSLANCRNYDLSKPGYHGNWRQQMNLKLSPGTQLFTYDLLIVYDGEKHDWVSENITKHLEDTGLKVCLPARDFALGAPMDVLMVEAVEKSRHVLVVISNVLDTSTVNWGSFVLRLASQNVNNVTKNHVFAMMLQNTNKKLLTQEEQTYVDAHACLLQSDSLWRQKLLQTISSPVIIDNNEIAVNIVS